MKKLQEEKNNEKKTKVQEVAQIQTQFYQDEELDKLKKDFEELKGEFDNVQNQLKRALADYQNLEKRINEGRSELTSFVGASIINKLLPVLDNLETAIEGVDEEERKSGWLKGVELAAKQFKEVLKGEGLEEIDHSTYFDPSLHEAVDTKEGEDNKILDITRKGYSLNNKVLRPAQVVVGRK